MEDRIAQLENDLSVLRKEINTATRTAEEATVQARRTLTDLEREKDRLNSSISSKLKGSTKLKDPSRSALSGAKIVRQNIWM